MHLHHPHHSLLLFLITTLLLPFTTAQYGNSSPSSASSSSAMSTPSTSSSGSSAMQTVSVGKNGFTFTPDSLVVAAGKQVVFQFYPGDHSVVQAAFDTPCQPANASSFGSGFVNSDSGPAKNVFTVMVNSTDPIWFYCGQVGHCQGGMVGVINPPSSGQSLSQFRSAATSAKTSTSPAGVQGGTLGAAPPSSGTTSAAAGSSPTGKSAAAGGWVAMLAGKKWKYAVLAAVPFAWAVL